MDHLTMASGLFASRKAKGLFVPIFVLVTAWFCASTIVGGVNYTSGGIFLIALALFAVMFPSPGLSLFFVCLFINPILDEVLPRGISPFLTLAAVFVGLGAARWLLKRASISLEKGIWVPLSGYLSWSALYLLADYGIEPRETFMSIAVPLTLFASSLLLIRSEKMVRGVIYGLLIGYVLFALVMLPHLITEAWINPRGGYLYNYVGEKTVLTTPVSVHWLMDIGFSLTLGFVAFSRGLRRFFWLSLGLVFASTSLFTFSRGAVLGIFTSLLCLCFLTYSRREHKQWLMFGLISSAVLVGFYSTPVFEHVTEHRNIIMEFHREGRYFTATQGLKAILHAPILGIGAGGSPTHSYLLDIPLQFGVPMALLYFYALFRLFRQSLFLSKITSSKTSLSPFTKSVVTGCFVAFAVTAVECVVDPVLGTHAAAVIFWFLRSVECYYYREFNSLGLN